MSDLSQFEGLDVAAVGVEMPNAGGGLQESMKFDPVEFHHGDDGYVVLHYTVTKVRFDPMTKGDVEPLRRVHVLHVDQAAPIDGKSVAAHLAKHQERMLKAKEKAEGVQRIPGVEGDGAGKDLPIGDIGKMPEEERAEGQDW